MSFSRFRKTLIAGLAGCTLLVSSQQASAQWTVFDPANYAQNILTAAHTLQQINNQIKGLENQATSLINQAKNLASLPLSVLAPLQAQIKQTQQLINQAQTIAYNVSQIQTQFDAQYKHVSLTSSNAQLVSDAQTRWATSVGAFS